MILTLPATGELDERWPWLVDLRQVEPPLDAIGLLVMIEHAGMAALVTNAGPVKFLKGMQGPRRQRSGAWQRIAPFDLSLVLVTTAAQAEILEDVYPAYHDYEMGIRYQRRSKIDFDDPVDRQALALRLVSAADEIASRL
jgi:hypothetical protein